MKTKFLALTVLPESFKNNLIYFEKISIEALSSIAELVIKEQRAKGAFPVEPDILKLSRETNLSAEKLGSVMGIMRFTAHRLFRSGDKSDDLVDDFLEEGLISQEAAKNFREILNKLMQEESIWAPHAYLEYEAVLPVYQNVTTRCMLMPKFDKEFKYFDDPQKYNPKVETLLPSVLLNILSDGPEGERSFGVILTEEDLEELQNILDLARKQLSSMKSKIKI